MERTRDTMCFGCGKDNPMGLHLHFRTDAEGCYTSFVPQPVHQSYDGRMHGGLISTLLDETMGNYPYMYEHQVAYTARLEVRFRQPVRFGERTGRLMYGEDPCKPGIGKPAPGVYEGTSGGSLGGGRTAEGPGAGRQ